MAILRKAYNHFSPLRRNQKYEKVGSNKPNDCKKNVIANMHAAKVKNNNCFHFDRTFSKKVFFKKKYFFEIFDKIIRVWGLKYEIRALF